MKAHSPIGFFDSGLGGLSVLREVSKELPHEDVVYLADNKRIPYGSLSPETVTQYVSDAIGFLEKKGVKLIVLACHTASAHWIRRKTTVPVLGMIEPTVCAIEAHPKERLAVFGTPSTIGSGVYDYEMQCSYGNVTASFTALSKLVAMIESNWLSNEEMEALIRQETASIGTVQTALLACTHYPLIKKSFQKVLGEKTHIIDPARELALQLKTFLKEKHLLNRSGGMYSQFFVTETPDLFSKKVQRFLNTKILPDLCTI